MDSSMRSTNWALLSEYNATLLICKANCQYRLHKQGRNAITITLTVLDSLCDTVTRQLFTPAGVAVTLLHNSPTRSFSSVLLRYSRSQDLIQLKGKPARLSASH